MSSDVLRHSIWVLFFYPPEGPCDVVGDEWGKIGQGRGESSVCSCLE